MILITLCILVAVFVLAFAGLRLIAPTIIRTSHKIEAPGIDRMEMVESAAYSRRYISGDKTQTTPSSFGFMGVLVIQ